MAGYLRRSVRHFLVDEARKTPIGAVRRKLEELVAATPEFVQVPAGTLGRAAGSSTASRNRPTATSSVRWSPRRTRCGGAGRPLVRHLRAPLAPDESLIAIIRAILCTAAGSL